MAAGVDRLLRSASYVHRLSGNLQRAAELATAALDYSRSIARAERRSADVGQAALLRAKASFDLGSMQRATEGAALAEEALRNGFGPEHADTVAAAELLDALNAL